MRCFAYILTPKRAGGGFQEIFQTAVGYPACILLKGDPEGTSPWRALELDSFLSSIANLATHDLFAFFVGAERLVGTSLMAVGVPDDTRLRFS
jgi:hypothetical protein